MLHPWLVAWLLGGLVGWLVCWLVGVLVAWLVRWCVAWLVAWLVGFSVASWITWLLRLVCWLVCGLFPCKLLWSLGCSDGRSFLSGSAGRCESHKQLSRCCAAAFLAAFFPMPRNRGFWGKKAIISPAATHLSRESFCLQKEWP